MKVILLAGGLGTRLSEYTETIPKPMVPIGEHPILRHIMCIYAHYGHKDFLLALGYKAEKIKEYFLHYRFVNSNFSINLGTGEITPEEAGRENWNVSLIDTGLTSMTGGRLKRIWPFIGKETCMATYGDGLADIDLRALLDFHRRHGKLVTVTAVHPGARFGELIIEGDNVTSFQEKPQIDKGWINGGFFVFESGFVELIDGDNTYLEREPLEEAAKMGELMAYKHQGFWHCMDTDRDRQNLEKLWRSGNAPWKR